MEHEKLTERIIGAAIEVHRRLGPGFLESIYEKALCIELKKRGIPFRCQLLVPDNYDEEKVGEHRLDLLVEDLIVVENKTIKDFAPIHFAIVKSYLNATHLNHGLLFNFAAPTLGIKRVMRT